MSISSRITEIEQHITNAYDKIDDLGIDLTNVDKNIDNIASMLEDVWDEYPKVTATDVEEASINGTKKGRMEIDLKGQTSQEQLSGKNLYNDNAQTTEYYINASGEWTKGAYGEVFIETLIETNIANNYVISFTNRYGTTPWCRFSFFNGDTFISRSLINTNGATVNVPNNTTKIYIHTSKTNVLYFENLQIEQGSTATSYEPYCRTEYQAPHQTFHNKLKM